MFELESLVKSEEASLRTGTAAAGLKTGPVPLMSKWTASHGRGRPPGHEARRVQAGVGRSEGPGPITGKTHLPPPCVSLFIFTLIFFLTVHLM